MTKDSLVLTTTHPSTLGESSIIVICCNRDSLGMTEPSYGVILGSFGLPVVAVGGVVRI